MSAVMWHSFCLYAQLCYVLCDVLCELTSGIWLSYVLRSLMLSTQLYS